MYFSIPVSNEQIITQTPLGAKAITHIFFENKNDGAFLYNPKVDTISVSIAGRQICRDVPVQPFMTSSTYGVSRHKWQDVALEVGINVDMSEVRISANVINDINVVLVYSDKELSDTRGYDFVEAKRFDLISVAALERLISEAEARVNPQSPLYNPDYRAGNAYLLSDNDPDAEAIYVDYATLSDEETEDGEPVFKWKTDIAKIKGCANWCVYPDVDGRCGFTPPDPWRVSYGLTKPACAQFGEEHTVTLDRAPQRLFAFQNISYTEPSGAAQTLIGGDVKLKFTLSGTEEQELPPGTDLSIIEATQNVPWRQVVYDFSSPVARSPQIIYDVQSTFVNGIVSNNYGMDTASAFSRNIFPKTWDLFFVFLYKKTL